MWAMSHELRTPLNGIIGLSESLLMGHFGGPLAQDAERVVSIIKASGSHLLQLVDDVLDAAALQKVRSGAVGGSVWWLAGAVWRCCLAPLRCGMSCGRPAWEGLHPMFVAGVCWVVLPPASSVRRA